MAQTQTQPAPRRIVVLNALPLNALPRAPLRMTVEPMSAVTLARWLEHMVRQGYAVVHYIRHPATIRLLRDLGAPIDEQPNSGLYQYADGDIIIVVTLRQPQRGAEIQRVEPGDVEAWEVRIQPIA